MIIMIKLKKVTVRYLIGNFLMLKVEKLYILMVYEKDVFKRIGIQLIREPRANETRCKITRNKKVLCIILNQYEYKRE